MRELFLSVRLMSSILVFAPAHASEPDDPYLWLEEVSSPRAMAWVEQHNAATVRVLGADPRFKTMQAQAEIILGAKDRIPTPELLRGEVFNFWQDAEHLRGLWRRTSLADYRNAEPHWTVIVDVDALNKAEGKSWVWRGTNCLEPEETRCMVALSDGGEDAVVMREIDLDSGTFVTGGFTLPRGKSRVAWEDRDTLLVAAEWNPGDLTTSGYPFIVKRLKRGRPLSAAVEVFRGRKDDGGYGVTPQVLHDGEGRSLTTVNRPLDTYRRETYVLAGGKPKRLAAPAQARLAGMVGGRVLWRLDEDWKLGGGRTLAAGTLASTELGATRGKPGTLAPVAVWTPGPTQAFQNVLTTRSRMVVTYLDDVQARALIFSPAPSGWTQSALDFPANVAVEVVDGDLRSNRAFLSVEGFLTPTTLFLVDLDAEARLEPVKSLPAQFDASKHVVEQLSATSTDGTKIPYFLVRPKDAKADGTMATLLTAYGGFLVAQRPSYPAVMGKLWLERGGAFVRANIRGGSEYGPRWHDAGLKTRRQVIYDDFAAVGKDLIARRLTSAPHLGIQGGSNGGLLMGVEMEQHPDLWNAVVIAVPLLDMIRIASIAAGASWQGEYGDVAADPEVRAFWGRLSPYQNLHRDVKYPEPFIWTTTKDDRVGPVHARKFAARMEEYGLPFLFYENTEGGHASGADLVQRAKIEALTYVYLSQKLLTGQPGGSP
jgi:prolyl oligopeptidase